MREYKFRGFDVVCGKWVRGHLYKGFRITDTGVASRWMIAGYEVFGDSIGQFTGCYSTCRDIFNPVSQEIYEGDILTGREKHSDSPGLQRWTVCYRECGFYGVRDDGFSVLLSELTDTCIVGNVYDVSTKKLVDHGQ